MYACVCVYMYICMCVYIYMYIYVCVCVCIYIYIMFTVIFQERIMISNGKDMILVSEFISLNFGVSRNLFNFLYFWFYSYNFSGNMVSSLGLS